MGVFDVNQDRAITGTTPDPLARDLGRRRPVISRIWAAASEQDVRLRRFRREHPEIVVITTRGLPKAWVGDEEITRATVCSLLDKLEEITGTQG